MVSARFAQRRFEGHCGRTMCGDAFEHPALFYRGHDDYLTGTVPFVRDGLARGEPVAVAVPTGNLVALRDALGPDAAAVRMLDMTRVGRNPGRIIPAVLRAFADDHPDRRVRIIGEPIWAERSDTEYPACLQHEALINLAFAGRAAAILCPYDADGLARAVLDDAATTHPVLIVDGAVAGSDAYQPERVVSACNQPFEPPPPAAEAFDFDVRLLPDVRRFVTARAAGCGLPECRVDDLELAVGELIGNTVLHGGGAGTVRIWTAGAEVVCEVSDSGHIGDPLAGRIPVGLDGEGGRGLLLVNLLADLVRVYTVDGGTTVRTYFRLF
jgi:anti-sigma regulatory factor (Ser/Thr protein kinase)